MFFITIKNIYHHSSSVGHPTTAESSKIFSSGWGVGEGVGRGVGSRAAPTNVATSSISGNAKTAAAASEDLGLGLVRRRRLQGRQLHARVRVSSPHFTLHLLQHRSLWMHRFNGTHIIYFSLFEVTLVMFFRNVTLNAERAMKMMFEEF